jgi:hypothetical protein
MAGRKVFKLYMVECQKFYNGRLFCQPACFFISGVLEGLASVNLSRFRFYAFVYGALAMGFLVFLYQLSNTGFNYYSYLWAGAYGLYSMWSASRNVRR